MTRQDEYNVTPEELAKVGMSESVKPDGIDLMAYLDNYCIPLVGAEAQIVKLCQQFANRQHLVLTADLRQENERLKKLMLTQKQAQHLIHHGVNCDCTYSEVEALEEKILAQSLKGSK